MIHGGWNRQKEARNFDQYSGPVAGPLEEDMISGGLYIQKELQESPNNTHKKPCQRDCALCDSGFKFSNHMKKRMKHNPVKNSYLCVLCGKCFISWKWFVPSAFDPGMAVTWLEG